MRFLALIAAFVFMSAMVSPAQARDELMPPPRNAPRIPVEVHSLDGGKDLREFEGKGEALDGERVMINGHEIRLFGIVTPALTSSFGPQTRLNLDRLLAAGTTVLCKVTDKDREGHPVAFCGTVKVPDLSYEMLRQGWAMVDRRALKGNSLAEVYEKAEQEAQIQNRGIFAPTPMAMAVPISDPAKTVTVPVPEAPRAEAPKEAIPIIPDIRATVEKLSAAIAPKPQPVAAAAPVVAAAVAAPAAAPGPSFVERYQILFGAGMLLVSAGVFGLGLMWRERKTLIDKRRSLAAALRGELMSARHICRTRATELLRRNRKDEEPRHPSQLWPRVRAFVYQAHVGSLGLLGAELARQVASVYGQCADYGAYYHSANRAALPHVVGETLNTLADHMDTLLDGLHEVEVTGRPLLGEDTMAEEDARAAAENVRLAMAASAKRALPAPKTAVAQTLARKSVLPMGGEPEKDAEDGGEENPEDDEGEGAEVTDIKSAHPIKAA